ncbi:MULTISPECIES: hypothetical protein [Bacillaceae]|uniref:hypothetical protein n=1 Tax=Bacillaceae TaxID=186817 RepID=UPI001E503CA1|nr:MULTISPECIES: hypothetical protein [Bacillaceae]MCE4050756.1 hypothetical protein [Bacillus sp. Au-Bac7]MCM3031623.1 hypothetical protein [Niallia sp. MER 6]
MRNEHFMKDSYHHGEHHKRKNKGHKGAKTFRRGRAIAFLEMMKLKRSTIKQQLEAPEFQSIQPILVGELKAIDMVINEFTELFEIQENEVNDTSDAKIQTEEANPHKGEESLNEEDRSGLE